jgi:hypothetical protein
MACAATTFELMDSATRPADPTLYERDFHAWCVEQASRLRGRARPGANDELDFEHLAEEIEGLASSDRRAIASHLKILLLHLLKWQFQSGMRSTSWRTSINNARDHIEAIMKDSPSLARHPADVLSSAYTKAVRDASDETGIPRRDFPATCPYAAEQALDPEFLPS